MNVTNKSETVLLMFSQLMQTYRKDYLYIGQDKMLVLLAGYHDYPIRKRMLNYRLAELEAAGLITRTQRNKRQVDGRIKPMTTLVFLTRRGIKYVSRKFRAWAKAVRHKIANRIDVHRPGPDPPTDQVLDRSKQKEKARELAATLA